MTSAGTFALEAQDALATEIFSGALQACSISSALDRRIRIEGKMLRRLLPDGSGPESFDLSGYKRIFAIAIGKAAAPMLDTLLDRLGSRKGISGICCSNQLPARRNWRFRYFEGGHPLPNEESFEAARAALALLRKTGKDSLIFFLISGGGSAMFDLPLDPAITLDDTKAFHETLIASGAPINEINTLRKHFSAVKGGRLAMAAPEAAKISLLLPDVPLRTLDALSPGRLLPITRPWPRCGHCWLNTIWKPSCRARCAISFRVKTCRSHRETKAGVRRFFRACRGARRFNNAKLPPQLSCMGKKRPSATQSMRSCSPAMTWWRTLGH